MAKIEATPEVISGPQAFTQKQASYFFIAIVLAILGFIMFCLRIISMKKIVAKYIITEKYYHGFVSEKIIGDNIEMTFLSASLEGIARWYLMFGDNAEILQPTALKKQVTGDWQKGSKIIHHFLSKAKHTTGDAYLLWRLKVMIAQEMFDVQGKVANMKDFEVKLKAKENVQ